MEIGQVNHNDIILTKYLVAYIEYLAIIMIKTNIVQDCDF